LKKIWGQNRLPNPECKGESAFKKNIELGLCQIHYIVWPFGFWGEVTKLPSYAYVYKFRSVIIAALHLYLSIG
jgi:hypothetical protein